MNDSNRRVRRAAAFPLMFLVFGSLLLTTALSGALQAASYQPDGSSEPSETSKTGVLQIIWGDSPGGAEQIRYFLADGNGRNTEIHLSEDNLRNAGILALDGKRVIVRNDPANQRQTIELAAKEFSGNAAAPDVPNVVSGNTKWLTILVRFSDSPQITPQTTTFIDNLFGDGYPGFNNFWRELSYNQINLTGSRAVGWYNLPHPRSYYYHDEVWEFDRAADDAVALATAAGSNITEYYGINLGFNEDFGPYSYGGKRFLTTNGVGKIYGFTWLSPNGYSIHSFFAHEMGHGYGLPHSSGTRACLPFCYDSQWDFMSSGISTILHPAYSFIAPHTIAYHKDLLGWIPASKKFTVPFASSATFNLDRLSRTAAGGNYLMGQIPLRGGTTSGGTFYTVETRLFDGYDTVLPGEAVIIHKVDPGDFNAPARVVTNDPNGDVNNDGARWLPGEVFTDQSTGVQIAVTGRTANGFTITATNPTRGAFPDFDGDRRADVSVFRPSNGTWYKLSSQNGSFEGFAFGQSADKIAPGDYDGDGRTDVAIYRPSSGVWYIWQSATNALRAEPFGIAEDVPVAGDYDRDGKTDIAVFRPSTGVWYIRNSGSQSVKALAFGSSTDKPVPADYDGDGKTDIAVFRPSNGVWYYVKSNSDRIFPLDYASVAFGFGTDKPVPADYDGDGKTDIAVYRPESGIWYVRQSATNLLKAERFGVAEDVPVASDYDGDGRADVAVYRPSNGVWYLQRSQAGFTGIAFGSSEDVPVNAR